LEVTDYDMLVSPEENKFNLNEEKLGHLIKWNPRLSPMSLYSRNLKRKFSDKLGRNPQMKWDLLSLINYIPDVDLSHERDMYEKGLITEEDIKALFGYEKNGEIVIRPVGKRILAGESIFHPDIWVELEKPFKKMVLNKLQPRIKGIYGVAMPKSILKLIPNKAVYYKAWVTRYPWVLPILAKIGVWQGMIFVDEELWEMFGGDFDGDQAAAFDWDSLTTDLYLDRDKEWLKKAMKMPIKEPANFEGRTEEEVIAKQLSQYSGCGAVYNNAMTIVDAARADEWKFNDLVKLQAYLYANIVQPFIDGFKYKGANHVPSLYDMVTRVDDKFDYLSMKETMRLRDFYRAIRSRGSLMDLTDVAKFAKADSKSFYERVVSIFKGWKRGNYIPISKLDETITKVVKTSFVKYSRNVEARYDSFKHLITSIEVLKEVIRNCYERKDYSLAEYLVVKFNEESVKEV